MVSHTLELYLALLAHRADLLAALVFFGFLAGDYLARAVRFDAALHALRATALRLRDKLNRADRPISTRVWRGVIATLMLTLPAFALGWLPRGFLTPLGNMLLLILLGYGFQADRLLAYWRQARTGVLPLELPGLEFLFADSHAVLRYLVLTSAERFSVYVVGVSFWYLVGGFPLAFCYVALAEAAGVFAVPVFGWAAARLFLLFHLFPRGLSLLILGVAACFVPKARPLAVLRAQPSHGAVARLLGISLGGALPEGHLAWEGEGTPKLLPQHLGRWWLLLTAAGVLLVLLLAVTQWVPLVQSLVS